MSRFLMLAYIQACIVGIAYGVNTPMVPVFAREEFLASYFDVGLIGMANYMPYMFAPALVGLLLDRFNKASLLTVGISTAMFSIFILSFTSSVLDVIAARAIAGIAHAFFWPATAAIVSTWAAEERRVQALSRFTMAWVGGYMIGPVIGGFLFEQFGFRPLFQYAAMIMLAALAISVTLIKHARSGYDEGHTPSTSGLVTFLTTNSKLSILIIYHSAALGIILTVYPAYLKDSMISEFTIGVLFTIFGLSRLFTLFFTDRLARSERASLAVATESIAFGMLLSYLILNFSSFSASLIMMGFAFSLYFPITLNMATRNFPRSKVGTAIGAYETIFGIGFAIGPIMAGLGANALGSGMPYASMFVVGMLLPILLIRLRSRQNN